MFVETFAAAFGTMGIAIIFNIRGKNLLYSSIGGGIGWLAFKLLLILGLSKISAMFISSLIISIYSEACARIFKCPVTIFVISALIPLVPGGAMYYTMYEAVKGNINNSLYMAVDTLSCAGSLAFGVIAVSTMLKIYKTSKLLISKKKMKR